MFYTLPKIWQGRIKKYWDKTMPSDYPASKSKFALKFGTEEETEAVNTFEAQLGTEESVVNDMLPENTFLSGYLGVYDVTAPTDEKILLSPEKVTSTDPFKVLHFHDGEWVEVENVELIDGYIWGTVSSNEENNTEVTDLDGDGELSPVAVIFYKKDIEIMSFDWIDNKAIVANGNPIKVYTNEEDNIVAKNLSSGKVLNLTEENVTMVVGGSGNGTDVESTDVTVTDVDNENIVVYGGSIYYDAEAEKSANVASANTKIINCKLRGATAGMGMVRITEYNITIDDATMVFSAVGQSYMTKVKKDVNKSLDKASLISAEWVKKAVQNITNATIQWLYTGGNSGYSYTVDSTLNVSDVTATGLVAGGSNGKSENVVININDITCEQIACSNRGNINKVSLNINNSKVERFYILSGDTGTVEEVSIDLNKGDYSSINIGKYSNEEVTDNEHVNYVKISRSANYTIDENTLNILGDKFIIK